MSEMLKAVRLDYKAARRAFIDRIRSVYHYGQEVEYLTSKGEWVKATVTFVPYSVDLTGRLDIFVKPEGRKMSVAVNAVDGPLNNIRPVGAA